jgi:hypothetical protein
MQKESAMNENPGNEQDNGNGAVSGSREEQFIDRMVHDCYWIHDHNCAVTMLLALSEIFSQPLEKQLLDASVGLHGAGGFRAQCGLVEGSLLFIGLYGGEIGMSRDKRISICYTFAKQFSAEFGSLTCRELRPGGFREDDPPHLCTDLTKRAIAFSAAFVREHLSVSIYL